MSPEDARFRIVTLWPEQAKMITAARNQTLGEAVDVAYDELANGAETVLIRNQDINPRQADKPARQGFLSRLFGRQ